MHTTPRSEKSAARSHSGFVRFELVSGLVAALVTSACVTGTVADDPGPTTLTNGAGGTRTVVSNGGSPSAGGAGSTTSSGGSVASGGSPSVGGSPSNGGSPSSGGSVSSGGSPVMMGGAGGSSPGCNVAAWVAGTHYTEGTKVSYKGNIYIATHDNDGLDPTVSTWYWSQSSCTGGAGGSTGTGGSVSAGGSGPIDPNNKKLAVAPGSVAAQYVTPLANAANRCAFIDAAHLAAQIDQESRWDPNAVSPIGAQGLTQFLPNTWMAYGVDGDGDGKADPFNPYDSIASQGNFMCVLAGQFGASVNWQSLLWAYNAGFYATQAAGGQAPTAEAAQYADLIINQLLPKYAP